MSNSRAAVRYAKALLGLALEKKVVDQVNDDMILVLNTLRENKQLTVLLRNPVLKPEVKTRALKHIFKKSHALSQKTLQLLSDKGRLPELEAVAYQYNKQYKELKGEIEAVVTTAVPLSDELKKKFLEKITNFTRKKVNLVNKINTDLIGGFVLQIEDLQFNTSMTKKLNDLKRQFSIEAYISKI